MEEVCMNKFKLEICLSFIVSLPLDKLIHASRFFLVARNTFSTRAPEWEKT